MNTFIEIVKNIATIIGCISGILTLIFTLSKKLRAWFISKINETIKQKKDDNYIKNLNDKIDNYIAEDKEFKKAILEDMAVQKDFARDQCRNIIKVIFYKYCENKRIPLYELKTVKSVFDTYINKLKGNSYITLLYNEISKWQVDYTQDLDKD